MVQRFVRPVQGLCVVSVRVMDVQDVDAFELQPLEALFDRAHDAVVGEVEHRVDRRRAAERLAWLWWRVRAKQAPDLARKDELITWLATKRFSKAQLG